MCHQLLWEAWYLKNWRAPGKHNFGIQGEYCPKLYESTPRYNSEIKNYHILSCSLLSINLCCCMWRRSSRRVRGVPQWRHMTISASYSLLRFLWYEFGIISLILLNLDEVEEVWLPVWRGGSKSYGEGGSENEVTWQCLTAPHRSFSSNCAYTLSLVVWLWENPSLINSMT